MSGAQRMLLKFILQSNQTTSLKSTFRNYINVAVEYNCEKCHCMYCTFNVARPSKQLYCVNKTDFIFLYIIFFALHWNFVFQNFNRINAFQHSFHISLMWSDCPLGKWHCLVFHVASFISHYLQFIDISDLHRLWRLEVSSYNQDAVCCSIKQVNLITFCLGVVP